MKIPVIALVTMLLLCPLNAWINIAIRHAPDRKTAVRDTVSIFLNLLTGIGALWTAFSLVHEITSTAPLNRAAVFTIVLDTAALFAIGFLVFIWWVTTRILRLIEKQTDTLSRFLDTYTKDLTNR